MNTSQINWKKCAFWGSFVMLAMLVFSMLFGEERMFVLDPNWMTLQFLQRESLAIQESRYGSFITHLFPVMGIKLNLSLTTILQLYNASFFIFFSFTYYLLYRWKQYDLNVLLLLYFSLFVGDVFFWPNNEVHQGVAWAFLGLGLYFRLEAKQTKRLWLYGIPILLLALGLVSHMLVIFAVLPIWIFRNFQNNGAKTALTTKHLYIGLAIILGLFAIKFLISSGTGYDKSKLDPIKHISFKSAFKSLISPHALDFYPLLVWRYLVATSTFLFVLFLLIKRKNYWSLTVFLIGILGFWIVINLVYPGAMDRALWFYMESEYQVMSVMLFAPLIYVAQPQKLELNITKALVLLSVIACGYRVIDAQQMYTKRLQNLDTLITYASEKGISKGILILDGEQSKKYFLMDWGLPVETLFRSTIQGKTPLTVKPLPNISDWQIAEVHNKKNKFLSSFSIEGTTSLPAKYLQIDSLNTYKIIPITELEEQLEVLY